MPGTVTASGIITNPLLLMATLLANSSTFRSLMGVGSVAAAIERIHYPEADDTDDTLAQLPRAILTLGHEWESARQGIPVWHRKGSLFWSLEAKPNPRYEGNVRDETLDFANNVGLIIKELENNAGIDQYFNATKFTQILSPQAMKPDEESGVYFYAAVYLVEYVG